MDAIIIHLETIQDKNLTNWSYVKRQEVSSRKRVIEKASELIKSIAFDNLRYFTYFYFIEEKNWKIGSTSESQYL